jgi:hypothetical protein
MKIVTSYCNCSLAHHIIIEREKVQSKGEQRILLENLSKCNIKEFRNR